MLLKTVLLPFTILYLFGANVGARKGHKRGRSRRSTNYADADPCACGITNDNRRFNLIVNGSIVRPANKYPWIVEILLNGQNHCAGAIITTQFVLTAGHCVFSPVTGGILDATTLTVTPTPEMRKPAAFRRMVFQVGDIVIHPQYNPSYYGADIAIIKLAQPIVCNEMMRPICLPHSYENLHEVTAAGIGDVSGTPGSTDNILREASLIVQDNAYCYETAPDMAPFGEDILCSFGNNKQPCHGDSGSSIFAHDVYTNIYYSVGVVSSGSPVCDTTKPAKYTSVLYFLNWIEQTIQST